MIDLIFSQLQSWLGWIVAGAGGLVVIFFQRWRNKRLQEKLDWQDRVISTHEAKEEINRRDQATQVETDKRVIDMREKVDNAETKEQATRAVSDGLDGYFGGNN
jgi:hypothetical protein